MEQTTLGLESWPADIFAITLFVEDLRIAKNFYSKVFGLPVEYEDNNSAVFKFRNTLINLLIISAAQQLVEPARVAIKGTGTQFVFTVHVKDVDAMCEELISRGIKLLNGPVDRPWGIRTASFLDPDGYIWEIAK
jgi:catechol 2,3-dioxygenase-like lactoylglutathione lyase family enzyme